MAEPPRHIAPASHAPGSTSGALYYPFHLCHERTLHRLLESFPAVHFREFGAIRFTPLSGLTAFPDRMGDYFPDLLAQGKIVQGYAVDTSLSQDIETSIDHDLADLRWRRRFHEALADDRRFQRGLFDLSHRMTVGGTLVPGPAALLRLIEPERAGRPQSLQAIRARLDGKRTEDDVYDAEYGMALVKTAAALHWTIHLSIRHALTAATDSRAHYDLLALTSARERLVLANVLVPRDGY